MAGVSACKDHGTTANTFVSKKLLRIITSKSKWRSVEEYRIVIAKANYELLFFSDLETARSMGAVEDNVIHCEQEFGDCNMLYNITVICEKCFQEYTGITVR